MEAKWSKIYEPKVFVYVLSGSGFESSCSHFGKSLGNKFLKIKQNWTGLEYLYNLL